MERRSSWEERRSSMSPASLSEEESSSSSVSIDRIDPFMSSIASLGRERGVPCSGLRALRNRPLAAPRKGQTREREPRAQNSLRLRRAHLSDFPSLRCSERVEWMEACVRLPVIQRPAWPLARKKNPSRGQGASPPRARSCGGRHRHQARPHHHRLRPRRWSDRWVEEPPLRFHTRR